MRFSICSKIGEPETVILHRPGKEANRLTPDSRDGLPLDGALTAEGPGPTGAPAVRRRTGTTPAA